MNRDSLTPERRSWNMSRIRGKDTAPERIVRSVLHRMGYRFRLHVRIPITPKPAPRSSLSLRERAGVREKKPPKASNASDSTPRTRHLKSVSVDILLPKYKTAIFVHGCFWHRHKGCKNCTTPTNRREWWLAKLNGNAARDKLHQAAMRKLGWRTIVVWECQTEQRRNRRLIAKLLTLAS